MMTDPFSPPPSEHPPPPYGAPQYGAPQYGGPPNLPARNGFGVTAMVLGIISIVLFFIPGVPVVLGVLAIVFAVLGRKRVGRGEATNGGIAIAGLVTGIVGLLIGAVVIVFLAFFADAISNYQKCIDNSNGSAAAQAICQQQLQNGLQN
jgi:hypothetical protein